MQAAARQIAPAGTARVFRYRELSRSKVELPAGGATSDPPLSASQPELGARSRDSVAQPRHGMLTDVSHAHASGQSCGEAGADTVSRPVLSLKLDSQPRARSRFISQNRHTQN